MLSLSEKPSLDELPSSETGFTVGLSIGHCVELLVVVLVLLVVD